MQVSQTELAKNSVDVLEMANELLSSNVTNIDVALATPTMY